MGGGQTLFSLLVPSGCEPDYSQAKRKYGGSPSSFFAAAKKDFVLFKEGGGTPPFFDYPPREKNS
jgi:hypothetical protein